MKQTPVAVLSGALTGSDATALHFKGVLSAIPDNIAEYKDGDVILVGDKEYVFYGGTFFELGDASGIAANAAGISNLEHRVTSLEQNAVKSVNGVTPDTNGNVTIALTEGAEGTGIASVVQTTTSTADSGINVITVTLTNGETSTFNIRNGSSGSPGATPVRGTDYWTAEDQQSMVNDVLAALPVYNGEVADV